MIRIQSALEIDPATGAASHRVAEGCEWVFDRNAPVICARMIDGVTCRMHDRRLWTLYLWKPYERCRAPRDFLAAEPPHPQTGEQFGWCLVTTDECWAAFHRAIVNNGSTPPDGMYTLVGPTIRANPEGVYDYFLIPHGQHLLAEIDRSFEGLKRYLAEHMVMGIVFHHPGGQVAKLRKNDLYPGSWPPPKRWT